MVVRLVARVVIAVILMPVVQHLCGLADWGYEPRTEAYDLLVTEGAPCHSEAAPEAPESPSPWPGISDSAPPDANPSCCSFQMAAPVTSPPVAEEDSSRTRLLLHVLPAQFVVASIETVRPLDLSLADPPPPTRPAPYLFYAHLLI